jgi:hypothetical protein
MIKFRGRGHDTCSIVTGVTSTNVDTISACHFQQYFSYIVVVRWRKLENTEKTFDLLQVTDKFCPFKVVWRLLGMVDFKTINM